MKSNSPIEVDVDNITESCAQVDGDEDLLSPLCTITEDTEDRSVVNGESWVTSIPHSFFWRTAVPYSAGLQRKHYAAVTKEHLFYTE